jgi:hypothetical protein
VWGPFCGLPAIDHDNRPMRAGTSGLVWGDVYLATGVTGHCSRTDQPVPHTEAISLTGWKRRHIDGSSRVC